MFPGWEVDKCASALDSAYLSYESEAVEQMHKLMAYLDRPVQVTARPKLALIKKIDKPYYLQPWVVSAVEKWANGKGINGLAAKLLGVLASNKVLAAGEGFELVQSKLAITLDVAQGDISRALKKLLQGRYIECVDALYYPGLKAKTYKLTAEFLASAPALYTERKHAAAPVRTPEAGNNHNYLVKTIGWAVAQKLTLDSELLSDLSTRYNETEVRAIYRSLYKRESNKHEQTARKRA
jgi:DNA-binding MarR family transcriptional regulator